MTRRPVLGIFVGGASSRMGSPKGLLAAPDTGEPIVVRLARLARELGAEPALVGRPEPYVGLLPGLTLVADEPQDIGPLGGLLGAVRFAHDRPLLVVACDMPFVSLALLLRLVSEAPGASVLAPFLDGRWQPLFARYERAASAALAEAVARGVRSFQAAFRELSVSRLELSPAEARELRDWDEPADLEPTS